MNRKILNQPVYSPHFLYLRETARALKSAISTVSSYDRIVLDLGCLGKPYKPLFAGRYKAYVGIDLNRDRGGMLDIQADAHYFPVKSESVDTLLCTETIEHFRDPQRVVSEIHRVLKS